MKADPDTQCMERFRDGDEAAFRTLFLRYKKKIVNFCFWYCNDREIAEELAQEVFLRIYRAAPKYRPNAKFSTWIFQIATNVCLNELRKTRYRYVTESLDSSHNPDERQLTEIADCERHDPQNILNNHENEIVIHDAILNLPEKQRIALLLRVYNGFSYQEISSQMNCSESSVKSLIHRARKNLKKALL